MNQQDQHKRGVGDKVFRITPLNFTAAVFLILSVYVFVEGAGVVGQHYPHAISGWMFGAIFVLFALVVSFMDLILRNFFRRTKNLWLVELSFITLAIILFLLAR